MEFRRHQSDAMQDYSTESFTGEQADIRPT